MLELGSQDWNLLLQWFHQHGVHYPWAGNPSPWAIWVSEVMLQQTTVGAVLPRYQRWMKRFPTPASLAVAEEDEVLREWEGLGYYSRARNLAKAACAVMEQHGGVIPNTAQTLRTLPGVGEYIADALSSFAFHERRAAVDANGRRFAMRLAARVWDKELEKAFRQMVQKNMPQENPGMLNAAVMQFGQLVCTPRNPSCQCCPLSSHCYAYREGTVDQFPQKKQHVIQELQSTLLLLVRNETVYLHRRNNSGGRGLWVFPRSSELSSLCLPEKTASFKHRLHTYTRFKELLHPQLYFLSTDWNDESFTGDWVDFRMVNKRPMPSVYRLIWQEFETFYQRNEQKKLDAQ